MSTLLPRPMPTPPPLPLPTPAQRARASRNFQKQIPLHEAKIDNPGAFVKGWDSMSTQQQRGLIKHWQKELSNFADQQSILHGL